MELRAFAIAARVQQSWRLAGETLYLTREEAEAACRAVRFNSPTAKVVCLVAGQEEAKYRAAIFREPGKSCEWHGAFFTASGEEWLAAQKRLAALLDDPRRARRELVEWVAESLEGEEFPLRRFTRMLDRKTAAHNNPRAKSAPPPPLEKVAALIGKRTPFTTGLAKEKQKQGFMVAAVAAELGVPAPRASEWIQMVYEKGLVERPKKIPPTA